MGDSMIRPVVIYPDERLTAPCLTVKTFDKSLHRLVDDLFDTMYRHNGVGLAAPQIGDGRRVFVMDVREGKEPHNPLCFINPELLAATGAADDEEGCLSVPGLFLMVRRATHIHFGSQTLSGDRHMGSLRGLEARVFQHELDHTQGVLFTQRATAEERLYASMEPVIAGKR
jgi:peptide deformylase